MVLDCFLFGCGLFVLLGVLSSFHVSQVVFCGWLACFHCVRVEDRSVCSSPLALAFAASAACLECSSTPSCLYFFSFSALKDLFL